MQITATWGKEEVAVEVEAECRTLGALKALLQDALPEVDVGTVRLEVGGRELTDDDDVCGLEAGCVVAVKAAVLAAATLREEGWEVDFDGFCRAAGEGDLRRVGLYLDAGVSCIPDRQGPLHMACRFNHVEVVRLLVDRGCAISGTNENGTTPLHIACMRNGLPIVACESKHVAIATLLLDGGCAMASKNMQGQTPLHFACRFNDFELVKLLVDRGAAISADIQHVAQSTHNMDIVLLLRARAAHPQRKAMQITATWGKEEVAVEVEAECRTLGALKALLQDALPEVDVGTVRLEVGGRELTDDDDVCGLEAGCVVELSVTAAVLAAATLREEGWEVDFDGFCRAAGEGDLRRVGLYLDAGVSCIPDRQGPLHMACLFNHVEVVRLLVDRGCAISGTNENGTTPLHIACMRNGLPIVACESKHVAIATLLLDGGCAMASKNMQGQTPLHFACRFNDFELVKLLVDRGAAISADIQHVAQSTHNMDIVLLLRARAAHPQRRAMQITATWGKEEVAVEVEAECRTLGALKALLQDALPEVDVGTVRLEVGGRELTDDDDVCGLEAGCVVELSVTAAVLAAATLREEGWEVDFDGFCRAAGEGDLRRVGLYLDAGVSCIPDANTPPHQVRALFRHTEIFTLMLDRGVDRRELTAQLRAFSAAA